MLDINYIRENAATLKTAIANKQLNPEIVDAVLTKDEERRTLISQVEIIRRNSNENVAAIKLLPGQKPTPELIERGRQLKADLQNVEPELKRVEAEFRDLMMQVANPPADDVPVGANEEGNQVMRQVGEVPNFDFPALDHLTLMENLDLVDTKRATEIGGFRSYFLKNEAVLMEQAIIHYSFTKLAAAGFTPMTAPILVKPEAMWGTGYFPWGQEDHYQTQDGQILAGTAEVALTSYRQNEVLTEKDLPYKMVGISPCFRREVGSYGKDTQGIIRVHQFTKVEQVVYTVADETETRIWHEKMVGFAEELLTDLGLPYQVLAMCTGDMGAGQRKKYDIETWFPSQNKYRETHSASYFNDFQSRRLNIRYQSKDGLKYVYTLNNTMAASPRLLAAIIENYQQADGSVVVPKILQPLVGKSVITK